MAKKIINIQLRDVFVHESVEKYQIHLSVSSIDDDEAIINLNPHRIEHKGHAIFEFLPYLSTSKSDAERHSKADFSIN